jgi:hypothetical protein
MLLIHKILHRKPRFGGLWRCLALCVLLARTAHGAPEYEVKAAQTAKFASYVEWPASARGGSLIIGLVGRDPSGGTIEQALTGANVSGRRVELRRVSATDTAGLRECNILFVSGSEEDRAGEIIRQVQGYPVLTVGESANFAASGGMLEFIVVDGQIRYVANPNAAARSGLKLTSGLLRIARRVVGG